MKQKKQWIQMLVGIIVVSIVGYVLIQEIFVDNGTFNNLEEEYNHALGLIDKGQLEEARLLLEQLSAKDSGNGLYDYSIGNTYRLQSNYNEALKYYEQAMVKSPKIKEVYNNIAAIKMTKKKRDEALLIVDQGLAVDPNFQELIFKKAQLLYYQGDYPQAIQLLDKVDKEQYIDSYRFYAMTFLKMGDNKKSLEYVKGYLNHDIKDENLRKAAEELKGSLERVVK